MKELIKNFDTVLKTLILPKFDSVTDIDIMAGTITGDESEDYLPVFRVQVSYIIKNEIKNKEQMEIDRETRSLFNMMGFPEMAKLRIFFTKIIG